MSYQRTIKELVILTLSAAVVALLVNTFSPHGISLITPPAGSNFESSPFTGIDFEAVKALSARQSCVFADARPLEAYQKGHIPGAEPMPVYDLDDYLLDFMEKYPENTTVVAYCSGINCTDSHLLAEELYAMGYMTVLIFTEGFSRWEKEGLAIET